MTDQRIAMFESLRRKTVSHPLLSFSIFVYVFLNLAYLFLLPERLLEDFDNYYSELILLTLVTLLFAGSMRRAASINVRNFWRLISLGFGTWLLVRILSFVLPGWTTADFELFTDVLFLFFFSFIIVAIELRLHRKLKNAWLQRHTATAIGGILLVFAVFGYFSILPVAASTEPYAMPFALHAALDGYISIRFFLAAVQAGSRSWRNLLATFGVVFLLIFSADMLSWVYQSGIMNYVAGSPLNIAWFAWYPVAMFASTVQPDFESVDPESDDVKALLPLTNGVLVFGLALPLIHAIGYGFDLFLASARMLRDLFVAAWIVVTSALLFGAYYLIRDRIGKLDDERTQAETKAGEFEGQLNRELRIRSLGRLSAGLAHDFGNTVSAIAMHATAATSKLERGEPATHEMSGLTKGVEYAQDLVGKLRKFGATSEYVATDWLNFNEEVRRTISVIQPSLPATVQFQFMEHDDELTIRADSSMVHQVVTNFPYNAIDAVGGSGRIDVEIGEHSAGFRCGSCGEPVDGKYAVIRVNDSGPGVAESLGESVFEPLVTTKPVGQGGGLGLSTVSGIMHNIGGHVGLAKSGSGGTSFAAYFPVRGGAG